MADGSAGHGPFRLSVEGVLAHTGVVDMPDEQILVQLLRDLADALDLNPTGQLRVAMLSASKDLRGVLDGARSRQRRERESEPVKDQPVEPAESSDGPASLEDWRDRRDRLA